MKDSTMSRTDPTTRKYWTPNVSSAEAEKPCCRMSLLDPREEEFSVPLLGLSLQDCVQSPEEKGI